MLITTTYYREQHDSNYRDLIRHKKEQVWSFYLTKHDQISHIFIPYSGTILMTFLKNQQRKKHYFLCKQSIFYAGLSRK